MLHSRYLIRFVSVLAVLTLVVAAIPASAQKLVPKVDNFILFLDQSSSMKFTYKGKSSLDLGGQSKVVLAQSAMTEVNNLIPDLKYTSGVATFAPYKIYASMAPYSKATMAKAIDAIDVHYEHYGRLTPMGPGLLSLDAVLSGLSGKTAVIIFSDGGANLGIDAVVAAKQLQAKYGDRLCYMVVSFADDKRGEDVLKQIAALSRCSCLVQGDDFLRNQAARETFLRCGLYELAKDETAIFRSIYFDFNKAVIKPEFPPVLDEGVAMAKNNPKAMVLLDGHTDSIGSEAYNLGLSNRRAAAVKAYFVKKGVDASRIVTTGYGKTRPRADNATADGRKLNRRVEIRFKGTQ